VKVLVVAPNWIGDVLMAQPLLRFLKQDPSVELSVLASQWVAPVLEVMPQVDVVIGSELRHGALQWGERRRIARLVRSAGFQRAFVLPNSFKSALIPWLARVPERIGYASEARGGLLTCALPKPGRHVSMSEAYLRLAGAAEALPSPPELSVPPARSAEAREQFGLSAASEVVALCPGAEFGPAKQWPAHHFAQLADLIHASDPGQELVILGSTADRLIAGQIAAASKAPVRVLAGHTSLAEAIALISGARAVVSNDSGLMHIAAALGRPQVALFGSTDPRHTPPRSARAQVLWLHLECSPCFKRVCPLGHLNCLNGIEPASVKAALEIAAAS
jgi:heptosyltransferase-2